MIQKRFVLFWNLSSSGINSNIAKHELKIKWLYELFYLYQLGGDLKPANRIGNKVFVNECERWNGQRREHWYWHARCVSISFASLFSLALALAHSLTSSFSFANYVKFRWDNQMPKSLSYQNRSPSKLRIIRKRDSLLCDVDRSVFSSTFPIVSTKFHWDISSSRWVLWTRKLISIQQRTQKHSAVLQVSFNECSHA